MVAMALIDRSGAEAAMVEKEAAAAVAKPADDQAGLADAPAAKASPAKEPTMWAQVLLVATAAVAVRSAEAQREGMDVGLTAAVSVASSSAMAAWPRCQEV